MTNPIESDDPFIQSHTTVLTLPAGRVLIRPIASDDKERLERGLEQLSPESRYRRFFAPVDHFSELSLIHI